MVRNYSCNVSYFEVSAAILLLHSDGHIVDNYTTGIQAVNYTSTSHECTAVCLLEYNNKTATLTS
jgi:hypothetical protein